MVKLSTVREVGAYQARKSLSRSRAPMRRIFASGGGHGSVFLKDTLKLTLCKIHVRPDIAFAPSLSLDDYPDEKSAQEFEGYTGFELDLSKNINDNIMSYLQYVDQVNAIVLFSRMSRLGHFFTKNAISDAICMVRHPLHAYISFIGHRHPKASDHLGGLESEDRIRWYAEQWNLMTTDYLDSGSDIIRFEFMQDDVQGIENPDLPYLLRSWRTDKRNHGILDADKVSLLKDLVGETYYRVYDDWDI